MTHWQEAGRGIIEVPRQVADYCITLAGHATHHDDEHAARHLANLAERYGADMVCGRTVGQWRGLAVVIEAAREIPDDPTTTGEPVDTPNTTEYEYSRVTMLPGSRPSGLRIEDRANGSTRFRIEAPGCPDAIVDLTPDAVASLVESLRPRSGS